MYRGRIATVLLMCLFAVGALSPLVYAQTSAPATSKVPTSGESDDANRNCPKEDKTHKYDKTRGPSWLHVTIGGSGESYLITNLYGKVCEDKAKSGSGLIAVGKCVAPETCHATAYLDQDGKLRDIPQTDQKGEPVPQEPGKTPTPASGSQTTPAPDTPQKGPTSNYTDPSATTDTAAPNSSKISPEAWQDRLKQIESIGCNNCSRWDGKMPDFDQKLPEVPSKDFTPWDGTIPRELQPTVYRGGVESPGPSSEPNYSPYTPPSGTTFPGAPELPQEALPADSFPQAAIPEMPQQQFTLASHSIPTLGIGTTPIPPSLLPQNPSADPSTFYIPPTNTNPAGWEIPKNWQPTAWPDSPAPEKTDDAANKQLNDIANSPDGNPTTITTPTAPLNPIFNQPSVGIVAQNPTIGDGTQPIRDFVVTAGISGNSGTPALWRISGNSHIDWTQECTSVGCAVNIAGPDLVREFWPTELQVIAQAEGRKKYFDNEIENLAAVEAPKVADAVGLAPTAQETFTQQASCPNSDWGCWAKGVGASVMNGSIFTMSAEAKTSTPKWDSEAEARELGQQKFDVTAYYPCTSASACPVQGGPLSSVRGPDGEAMVRTLDDYRLGKSEYVTGASDRSRYGETYVIPEITYKSALDGKTYTLADVPVAVHDTGGAFKGRPDKLDIAAGVATSEREAVALAKNQPFLGDQYQTYIKYSTIPNQENAGPAIINPPIQNLGADSSAPLAGDAVDSRQLLSSSIVPEETTPRTNEITRGPSVDAVRDINFAGLSTLKVVETGAPLADITPKYHELIPTAEWIPQAASRSGEDITRDMVEVVRREEQAAQLADRLAQADEDYAQIARGQAAQHADRLAQANGDAARIAQAQADQAAYAADRRVQAERESKAYVDRTLANLPLPPAGPTGEQITEQVNREIAAQYPALRTAHEVQLPTQKELWADLLKSSGQSTVPETYDGYYDAAGVAKTPEPVSREKIAAVVTIDSQVPLRDAPKVVAEPVDTAIRNVFDKQITAARDQVKYVTELRDRSESPAARAAAETLLDDSNKRLDAVVGNAISYAAGNANPELQKVITQMESGQGEGAGSKALSDFAHKANADADAIAKNMQTSGYNSIGEVGKSLWDAGAWGLAKTTAGLTETARNLLEKTPVPGFNAASDRAIADAIDPYAKEVKNVTDVANVAPFAVGAGMLGKGMLTKSADSAAEGAISLTRGSFADVTPGIESGLKADSAGFLSKYKTAANDNIPLSVTEEARVAVGGRGGAVETKIDGATPLGRTVSDAPSISPKAPEIVIPENAPVVKIPDRAAKSATDDVYANFNKAVDDVKKAAADPAASPSAIDAAVARFDKAVTDVKTIDTPTSLVPRARADVYDRFDQAVAGVRASAKQDGIAASSGVDGAVAKLDEAVNAIRTAPPTIQENLAKPSIVPEIRPSALEEYVPQPRERWVSNTNAEVMNDGPSVYARTSEGKSTAPELSARAEPTGTNAPALEVRTAEPTAPSNPVSAAERPAAPTLESVQPTLDQLVGEKASRAWESTKSKVQEWVSFGKKDIAEIVVTAEPKMIPAKSVVEVDSVGNAAIVPDTTALPGQKVPSGAIIQVDSAGMARIVPQRANTDFIVDSRGVARVASENAVDRGIVAAENKVWAQSTVEKGIGASTGLTYLYWTGSPVAPEPSTSADSPSVTPSAAPTIAGNPLVVGGKPIGVGSDQVASKVNVPIPAGASYVPAGGVPTLTLDGVQRAVYGPASAPDSRVDKIPPGGLPKLSLEGIQRALVGPGESQQPDATGSGGGILSAIGSFFGGMLPSFLKSSPSNGAGTPTTGASPAPAAPVDTKPITASVAFTSNPSTIKSGDTAQLSWAAIGSKVCTISAPDASTLTKGSNQGTFTTPALATSTLYKIACDGGTGTASAEVTVTVK